MQLFRDGKTLQEVFVLYSPKMERSIRRYKDEVEAVARAEKAGNPLLNKPGSGTPLRQRSEIRVTGSGAPRVYESSSDKVLVNLNRILDKCYPWFERTNENMGIDGTFDDFLVAGSITIWEMSRLKAKAVQETEDERESVSETSGGNERSDEATGEPTGEEKENDT